MEEKFIFDDWMERLNTFQDGLKKELKEFRKCKAEMQQIKEEIFARANKGYFMYDDDRIIISAPEIIIGNVDRSGELKGPSRVMIRANNIGLEGVGESGTVVTRATSISSRAEDPGTDGMEAVVYDGANITSLARTISIDSSSVTGYYGREAETKSSPGLTFHSDGNLTIDASISSKTQKNQIEAETKKVDGDIKLLETGVDNIKKSLKWQMDRMKNMLKNEKGLMEGEELLNTNVAAIDTMETVLTGASHDLLRTVGSYIADATRLAEAYRRKKILEQRDKDIKSGDEFNSKTTGATITINAESTIMTTKDGDGNVRTNDEAGIVINSPKMNIGYADEANGKLIEKSSVKIASESIALLTNDIDDSDSSNVAYPAKGEIRLNSKEIVMTSNDYMAKDNEPYAVKALTEKGKIHIEASEVAIDTANEKGEQSGTIDINGKDVSITTMDLDASSGKKDKFSASGNLLVLSPKVIVGSSEDNMKTELVQVAGTKTAIFATEEAQIAQGGDSPVGIDIKSEGMHVNTKQRYFYDGESSVYGKVSFIGNVESFAITADSLFVQKHFVGPTSEQGTTDLGMVEKKQYSTSLKMEKVKEMINKKEK